MSKDSLAIAINVFANINDESINLEEKGKAIKRILSMPTHNSVTKDMMLECIKFLYGQMYEESDKITYFDRIKMMSVDELANFIDDITRHCANDYCDNCPLESAFPCDVFALIEWLNSEVTE